MTTNKIDEPFVYIVFDSLDEVIEYYRCSLKGMDEDDIGIYRLDYAENPPHSDYKDCHIFLVFSSYTVEELNIPRAVLPKANCTEKDDDEIQQVEYIDELDIEPILAQTEWKHLTSPIFGSTGPSSEDVIN